MATELTSFRILPEDKEKLEALAASEKSTITDLVNIAVQEFLERRGNEQAIRIEVCERLMDHGHRPVYNEQEREYEMVETPKYHAQIAGKPGVWAAGNSLDEAIGDLVGHHPESFGIKVTYLEGKLPR